MSKLRQVRKALEGNPNITIVGTWETNYLPDSDGFWGHAINFYVAPKAEAYSIVKLQEMMMALVPGLEPTDKTDFRKRYNHVMVESGMLYFAEFIGSQTVHREVVLAGENMDGFTNGKMVEDTKGLVQRQIWVRLFARTEFAEIAFAKIAFNVDQHRISKQDLADCCQHEVLLINNLP